MSNRIEVGIGFDPESWKAPKTAKIEKNDPDSADKTAELVVSNGGGIDKEEIKIEEEKNDEDAVEKSEIVNSEKSNLEQTEVLADAVEEEVKIDEEKLSDQENVIKTNDKSFSEKIKQRYLQGERVKVEKYKILLKESGFLSFDMEREMVKNQPSTARQIGRMFLDTSIAKNMLSGLHKSSHEEREKEAMYVARQEYEAEREKEQRVFEKEWEERRLAEEKWQAEIKAEREAREKLSFEKDFIEGMDRYRQRKEEQYQGEAVQELSERGFNERLTKLEEIDLESETEGSGVTKRQIEFEGKNLTVYDMKGFQFSFLQHMIDFKGRGADSDKWRIGAGVAKNLQDNPSLWAELRNTDEKYGGKHGDSKANTISMSYIRTDENFKTINDDGYFYGFDQVRPDSILQIFDRDGGTVNDIGDNRTGLSKDDAYMPQMLENAKEYYNEVQLRRYDEGGRPQLPDFVVVKNGKMSDVILKHAAYFDVPIINIETEYYKKQEAQKLENLVDGIDWENDSYEKIKLVLDALERSYLVGNRAVEEKVGLWDKHPTHELILYNESLTEKIKNFKKRELAARVKFIKNKLHEETELIRDFNKRGEKYFSLNRGLEVVKVDYGKELYNGWTAGGPTMHRLEIKTQTQLKRPFLTTEVYDGDNPSPDAKVKYEGANSQVYNELLPVVEEYLAALEENKHLDDKTLSVA